MKQCRDCGEMKKLYEFHKNTSHKDGRVNQCSQCHSDYCREKRNVTCEDCGEGYYKRNKYVSCPHCLKPKKVCTRCKKRKYITQFYKNANAQDGRQSTCATCRASKQKLKGPWCETGYCVFYATCRARIKDRTFDPYCFVEGKYHGLYVQEYETAGVAG